MTSASTGRCLTSPRWSTLDVAGWSRPPRRALATLAAVRDSKGQALYAFLQVQDITAQSAAEEHLLTAARSGSGCWSRWWRSTPSSCSTRDGLVASWNSGAQRIKGYAADEIVGQPLPGVLPTREAGRSNIPEFELRGGGPTRPLRGGGLARPQGRQPVLGQRADHRDLRRQRPAIGFTKVTRDATERREAEQLRVDATGALEQANAELATANARLALAAEEQAKFLAVTAHELRSPVTVLTGSAATLAKHRDLLTADEVGGLVDGMTASAGRLQRLLSDLLTIARIEAESLAHLPARTELGPLLHRLAEAARVRPRGGRPRRGACRPLGARRPGPAHPGPRQPSRQRGPPRRAACSRQRARGWRSGRRAHRRQRRGRRPCDRAPAV